ncbi:MAG TPA: hypothetical protein VND65_18215 [Candidatus Binatia bacterium]|nr:hypothetical protein [Candidatus Binatia bacterium]
MSDQPAEVTVKDQTYRVGRLDARTQWKITKRLLEPLAEIGKLGSDGSAANPDPTKFFDQVSGPLAKAISSIKDEDSDFIIDKCLAVCHRKQGDVWAPLVRGGNLMFSDLNQDMVAMLSITFAVLKENLGNFFSSDQLDSSASEASPK